MNSIMESTMSIIEIEEFKNHGLWVITLALILITKTVDVGRDV